MLLIINWFNTFRGGNIQNFVTDWSDISIVKFEITVVLNTNRYMADKRYKVYMLRMSINFLTILNISSNILNFSTQNKMFEIHFCCTVFFYHMILSSKIKYYIYIFVVTAVVAVVVFIFLTFIFHSLNKFHWTEFEIKKEKPKMKLKRKRKKNCGKSERNCRCCCS